MYGISFPGQFRFRSPFSICFGYYGIGIEAPGEFGMSAIPRTTWAWDEFVFVEFKETKWADQCTINTNLFCFNGTGCKQLAEHFYINLMWFSAFAAWVSGGAVPRYSNPVDFNWVSSAGMPTEYWCQGYPDFRALDRTQELNEMRQGMRDASGAGESILPPN